MPEYTMTKLLKYSLVPAFVALAMSTFSSSALACAGCGHTLSSDWDGQGFDAKPGIRLDLRYDYLNQSQLRNGYSQKGRSSLLGTDEEIEEKTKNHYVTASLDYRPDRDWGVNVQLPYIDRYHETYGEDATALDQASISTSDTKSIGDAKVVGRYQGFAPDKNVGIQLGLKFPTGDYKKNFKSGPEEGNRIDRGLQPGTGTTDLLIGLYHFNSINRDWDYFAQGMVQLALDTRDNYQPGDTLNVNFGVRYEAYELFTPQLQINVKKSQQDTGFNSDHANSGSTLAYLSPGITAKFSDNVSAYSFVQLPIYQYVKGNQLAPTWTATLGLGYSF